MEIANSQALLSRYAQEQFDKIEELTTSLSEDLKKKLKVTVQVCRDFAGASLKSAQDAADTASRQLCTGSALRRPVWLRVSGVKPEVQSTINISLTGKTLFGPEVDETLQQLEKKMRCKGNGGLTI